MNVTIIYWSGTGNTEAMANYIKEGAEEQGNLVSIKEVYNASMEDVEACDVLVLGCPSMGAEVLEESSFQPFFDETLPNLGGKQVELFGSYDWGDGQWMRDWSDTIASVGALQSQESLIVNNTPVGDDIQKCLDFGKNI